MDRDCFVVAAATLTAAILDKTELEADADVAREALRIYRQTLRKITQAAHAATAKAGAGEKRES